MKKIYILVLLLLFPVISYTEGELIGKIGDVNNNTREIIVNAPGAGEKLKMGDKLYIRADGKILIIKVTYPMMTIAKCKLVDSSFRDLKKVSRGMIVYRYSKDVEADPSKNEKGKPEAGKISADSASRRIADLKKDDLVEQYCNTKDGITFFNTPDKDKINTVWKVLEVTDNYVHLELVKGKYVWGFDGEAYKYPGYNTKFTSSGDYKKNNPGCKGNEEILKEWRKVR